MNDIFLEIAELIFGEMREANKEEEEYIINYIKSISEPTSLNFWD